MKFCLLFLVIATPQLVFSQVGLQVKEGKNLDSLIELEFKKNRLKQEHAIGQSFPKFSVKTRDGLLTNECLKGKVVLVNFWFASCRPCIMEFKALNELYEKLKGEKYFDLISFTFETPGKVADMKKKYQLKFKIVSVDREKCLYLNQNNGYPTNIVIDKNGIVKFLASGGEISQDKSRVFITEQVLPVIKKELSN